MSVKFSVIVASYNYETLIQRTLKSLISQTFKNFEVIVVDDGSKDNSVKIIESFVRKFNNVKLFTHPGNSNRGLIETIKLGIDKAEGEFIAFCESDDYWDERHLEFIYSTLIEHPSAKIIANEIIIDNHSSYTAHEYFVRDCQNFLILNSGKNIFDTERCINRIPTFSAITIRKDLLLDVDWNSPIPKYIDYWIYRQLSFKYPVFFCKQAITYWYKHDESYDSVDKKEKIDNFRIKSDQLISKKYCNKAEYLEKIDYSKKIPYSLLPIEECGNPLVSVVIPIYGVENYILRSLHSVINQSYKNLEIILINDATKDRSMDLVSTIKDPRIKIINHKTNQGLAKSRNDGIEKASGEFIAFLDSDDYWDENFVEELLKIIVSTRADVAVAATNLILPDKTSVLKNYQEFIAEYLNKVQAMPNGACWNKLYRTDFIKENKLAFPVGLYWEDNIFTIKAAYFSNFFAFTNSTSYNYSIRNNSITTDFSKLEALKAHSLLIAEQIIEFNKDKISSLEEKGVIFNFIFSNFINKGHFGDQIYKDKVYKLFLENGYLSEYDKPNLNVWHVRSKYLLYGFLSKIPIEKLENKFKPKYIRCKEYLRYIKSTKTS